MIREYEESRDYEKLMGWWKAHGWDGLHPSFLKPVAIMCELEGKDVAFCVIWPVAGCGVAIMEWLVANPNCSSLLVFKAIGQLTAFCENWCRQAGYDVLLTTCQRPGLAKIHERNGFEVTDKGMMHLCKAIESQAVEGVN